MTVSNGQLANQTTFNSSFMSREVDTTTIGKVDLNNVAAASGASTVNVQKIVNSLASALGITTSEVYNFLFTYSSNVVGAANDTAFARLNALTLKFRVGVGLSHAHTGVDGSGEKISASDLLNINQYVAEWQAIIKTGVTGTSSVITTQMIGKVSGGGNVSYGVITGAPDNKCALFDSVTGQSFEDAGGQKVYGRVTYSAGVWTLTYYTNEAGVETSYNFVSSSNLQVFFLEVFSLSSRPTVPSSPEFGSLDITGDVVDASEIYRGVVNILDQQFLGQKRFAEIGFKPATDAASTGSLTIPDTGVVVTRLTNAALTEIKGINSTKADAFRILVNATGVEVLIKHDSAVSPAEGFLCFDSANVTMKPNAVAMAFYDSTSARWRVLGSGGGTAGGSSTTQAYELSNLGLSATISGSDLVVNLKQADGTTDPASGAGAVKIGFRSSTATVGGYNQRTVAAALSYTLNAKASLSCFGDTIVSINHDLWVYAIDSDGAGTIKLGVSPFKFPDLSLQSTMPGSQTFTVTVASPAVFTATAHGFYNGMKVNLTTTGALPTGLAASTYYFVKAVTANTFQLSLTVDGTSINTTGTQSGTHTVHAMSICIASDATYTNKPVRLIGYVRSKRNTTGGFTGWLTPTVVSANTMISEGMTPILTIPADVTGDGFGAGETTLTVGAIPLVSPYDPQGMLAGGSLQQFVCQVTGMYQIYVKNMLEPGASRTAGERIDIRLYVNGTLIGYVAQHYVPVTNSQAVILSGMTDVRMNRGDIFKLVIFFSGAGGQNANNDYENAYSFRYVGPANQS